MVTAALVGKYLLTPQIRAGRVEGASVKRGAVLIVWLVLAVVLLAPASAAADAETTAREFLTAIKAGELDRAKRVYDARYRSLPAEGTDALFRYESGYQPNLAFLIRQPFSVESVASIGSSRSEWYPLDGVRGNKLAVRIRFDGDRGPFFLPSPIAFGHSMRFVDFLNYVKHPESGGFGEVTLRLRPSVAPGVITPTPPPLMVKAPPPPVGREPLQRPAMAMPTPSFEGG